MTARFVMHVSGVNERYDTRLDLYKTVQEINITRFFNGGRPKWLLQFSVYQRGYYFITSSFQDAESELLCSPNWCEHCEEQRGGQGRPGQLSSYDTNTLDLAKTAGSIRTQ